MTYLVCSVKATLQNKSITSKQQRKIKVLSPYPANVENMVSF